MTHLRGSYFSETHPELKYARTACLTLRYNKQTDYNNYYYLPCFISWAKWVINIAPHRALNCPIAWRKWIFAKLFLCSLWCGVFLGTVVKCMFELWRETLVTITGCYSWMINIIHKNIFYFKCLLTTFLCVWLYRCCPLNVIIVQKCAVFYWRSLTAHASLS